MGTLWFNGSIYTMIKEKDQVEALYTEKGVIVDTGSIDHLKMNMPAIFPGKST